MYVPGVLGDIGTANICFRQIAAGLQFLHTNSILHRDVKPENILLSFDKAMTYKLCDFGLAKFIVDKTKQSKSCGTDWYRAPEVQTMHYGVAADWYSLGVTYLDILVLYRRDQRKLAEYWHVYDANKGGPHLLPQAQLESLMVGEARHYLAVAQSLFAAEPDERATIETAVSMLDRPTPMEEDIAVGRALAGESEDDADAEDDDTAATREPALTAPTARSFESARAAMSAYATTLGYTLGDFV
jgi:serine/threonine protein kinase